MKYAKNVSIWYSRSSVNEKINEDRIFVEILINRAINMEIDIVNTEYYWKLFDSGMSGDEIENEMQKEIDKIKNTYNALETTRR